MSNPFQKAKRALSYLNVAITGPSGSGKTWSALEIATGMGGKIAVVDTENGSAALYSKFFEFDVLTVNPPFTQDKYIRAVKAAVDNGYDIVVIDSFSHVWAGEGGAQEQKDALDARGGSKFANWKDPKAALKKVMSEMLQSKIHVIATMRSKQAYAQVADEKGRTQVKKMGMDPIAEPGIEYEFTTVFDMDMSHQAQASKDRTHLFDGKTFKPTKETGAELMAWRNAGEGEPPQPPEGSRSSSGASQAKIVPPTSATSKPVPAVNTSRPEASAASSKPDILGYTSPGDYVIKDAFGKFDKERIEWDGRTIRDVVDEMGLAAFMKSVNWWAFESGRKTWRTITNLKEYADEFEKELHSNHADAELTQQFKSNFENDNFEDVFPKGAAK